MEDRIKTRKQDGYKPLRQEQLVAMLEDLEKEALNNPHHDGFVGTIRDEALQQVLDARDQVLKIVESSAIQRKAEELRARHPSVPRKDGAPRGVNFPEGTRRPGSPSPNRGRGSSKERPRGSSGDRGRDARGRYVPVEHVRLAYDEVEQVLVVRTRSKSGDRVSGNTVRRSSKSPNRAYTGATVDPQELGCTLGHCWKCNAKDHRGNDPACPYVNDRLTTRCTRCFVGGHSAERCVRKSGNA